MAALVALSVLIGLCPLALLAPTMARVRRAGLRDYGRLCNEYTEAFNRSGSTALCRRPRSRCSGRPISSHSPTSEQLRHPSADVDCADHETTHRVAGRPGRHAVDPVIVFATPTREIVNLILKMVV